MPIFEYQCKKCDLKFEKIVFDKKAPSPACPGCGSEKVEKLISAPSVSAGGEFSGFGGGGSCGSGSSGFR